MLPLCEWNGLLVNVGFSKVMVVAIENTKSHHVIYFTIKRRKLQSSPFQIQRFQHRYEEN